MKSKKFISYSSIITFLLNEKYHKKFIKTMEKLPYVGFIFHVGLYSFYGYDDIQSARRRKIQNGSEWYLERLRGRDYRPVAGSDKTQYHHTVKYGANYDYFRAPFNITRESICEWLDLCVKCRASYVLITAKHHDGFCLWNTVTTEHKSSNDIILIFREEAIKRGLMFGLYYSWYEFMNSMTIDFFNQIVIPQLRELLTYSPQILWFDGDWCIKTKYVISSIEQICIYLKSLGILINDRICEDNKKYASFMVGPDRSFPQVYTNNWQHINTIGISWGYNKEQEKSDYKNGMELYKLLYNTVNLGGTFLLNIGPKHDGSLDEREVVSLNELSELLNV